MSCNKMMFQHTEMFHSVPNKVFVLWSKHVINCPTYVHTKYCIYQVVLTPGYLRYWTAILANWNEHYLYRDQTDQMNAICILGQGWPDTYPVSLVTRLTRWLSGRPCLGISNVHFNLLLSLSSVSLDWLELKCFRCVVWFPSAICYVNNIHIICRQLHVCNCKITQRCHGSLQLYSFVLNWIG
jgi:hypothetical protein